MISGHAGSLSTIHADTPLDALIRLETLSLMSDVQIPVYVARAQVASAIDLIVQIARFTEDGSRKITRITEVAGLDDNNRYQLGDLFVLEHSGKGSDGRLRAKLAPTGRKPGFAREVFQQGIDELVRHSGGMWEK
jgi:pilus assembly protein CpaF